MYQLRLQNEKDITKSSNHYYLLPISTADRYLPSPSLKSMTSLALLLGFAHEEEFVILAVVAGSGGNPFIFMIAHASSVAVALIGITLLSLEVYKHFQNRIINYSKYLPKIPAVLIAFMAFGFCSRIVLITSFFLIMNTTEDKEQNRKRL